MTAERDCEACYKAEYMLGFLGQTFPGVIVSVSDFGLYVELENTVTGLLRLEYLPEEALHFNGVASLTDGLGRPRVYRRPVHRRPGGGLRRVHGPRELRPSGIHRRLSPAGRPRIYSCAINAD